MKKMLLMMGIVVVGGFLFAYYHREADRAAEGNSPLPQSSYAPQVQTDSTLRQNKACPINNIHPGMLLQDVRSQLAGYVMDYRGTRQDQEVYYVEAGVCHAFIDFNSQDNMVDAIDYGLGYDKIEFRKNAPALSASSQSAAIANQAGSSDSSPPPSEPSKGYPVSEKTFVDAYVLANIGRDNLDKDQLEQLAHDEYRMGRQIDTQILLLGGGMLDTRGRRAMDYLDNLRRQHSPTQ
jgi:hypothetical protein